MNKVSINISQCIPGMRLAKDVVNVFGTTIAIEGTTIDERILRKLNLNKIESVYVLESVKDKTQVEFNHTYLESTAKVKEMMKDIGCGGDIDLAVVNELSQNITEYTSKSGSVVNWLNQVKEVDDYTFNHSVNVSIICYMIGKWLGYSESKLLELTNAGLLHDVGKAMIPESILNKPAALSGDEFEEIKKHPVYGFRLVEKIKELPKSVAYGVLMHHERENGSGYPMGAIDSQIHEFAKIIAVADVYDAMTSDRVYHFKEAPLNVLGMIQKDSFGQLDVKITMPFLTNIANYYIGDIVMLNTGETAQISFINSHDIAKPIVTVDNSVIDLSKESDLFIQALLL